MIGEIGAIGHAGITTIKTTSLAIRNFETEPFNGNQRNRHTGKTDAIYFADVMEAVNEKAGKHSTVLRNLQFIIMDQQQLEMLTAKRATIIARGAAATTKELDHSMRISDALKTANTVKMENDEKLVFVSRSLKPTCQQRSILLSSHVSVQIWEKSKFN